MNLESDKRLIQLRLDFSSAPTGEARQARREDIESLSVVSEPERPTNTLCLERVSATSRTAVYGPVRTVVWEGRSREAPPYPDPIFIGRGAATCNQSRTTKFTNRLGTTISFTIVLPVSSSFTCRSDFTSAISASAGMSASATILCRSRPFSWMTYSR
jgi:hypothetical protein